MGIDLLSGTPSHSPLVVFYLRAYSLVMENTTPRIYEWGSRIAIASLAVVHIVGGRVDYKGKCNIVDVATRESLYYSQLILPRKTIDFDRLKEASKVDDVWQLTMFFITQYVFGFMNWGCWQAFVEDSGGCRLQSILHTNGFVAIMQSPDTGRRSNPAPCQRSTSKLQNILIDSQTCLELGHASHSAHQ
mgnify:CR=1 FL=1